MESILNIIQKTTEIEHLDRTAFLAMAENVTFLPKNLTETKAWKKLPTSAKEIYRALATTYDYELGVSKITHAQILNEAGLGGHITVVKAIDTLEERGFIIRVENNSKSHCYLLPKQEKFYSAMCGFATRDFSVYYAINKKSKKSESQLPTTHKLFFKVCYNLSCLEIEKPDKLLDKYSSDGNMLRIIMSMCDSVYLAKKYNLVSDMNLSEYLIECLKNGNITNDIFDSDTMLKIKNILRKNKESSTE